jgi:hypothetical protein
MSDIIAFRCPRTGVMVEALLSEPEVHEPRTYEIVTCPACAQLHFINKATGKALGDKAE